MWKQSSGLLWQQWHVCLAVLQRRGSITPMPTSCKRASWGLAASGVSPQRCRQRHHVLQQAAIRKAQPPPASPWHSLSCPDARDQVLGATFPQISSESDQMVGGFPS